LQNKQQCANVYISMPAHTSPESISVIPASFYEQHQPDIAQLLDITGVGQEKAATLDTAVKATQPWVKGDHGLDSYSFDFTDEQHQELPELFNTFDMVEQRDLPAGHYDQVWVYGAVHLGNDKRLKFLADMLTNGGVSTDRIVLLGGERKMDEREPEDLNKNLARLGQKQSVDAWLQGFLAKPQTEVDESDMLRVAALDHLGPLALRKQFLRVGTEDSWRTSTPVTFSEFDWQSTPLTLVHSRATSRKDGQPRHTTETCTQDGAELYIPEGRSDAKIAIISSQPHLERMEKTVKRVLQTIGREVELVAGGPGTTAETGDTIYLGEVARNLYEDQQAITA
jgi:hypothetical protein